MDPAWIALIGTLFGGAGFKSMEHWLGRKKSQDEVQNGMRTELRLDSTTLRGELAKAETKVREAHQETDEWRDKYYRLVSKVAARDLDGALNTIKEDK